MDSKKYLLDTSVVVGLLRQQHTLGAILPADSETHLCDIVAGELMYGALRSARSESELEFVKQFVVQYNSLTSDLQVAEAYARVKATSMG